MKKYISDFKLEDFYVGEFPEGTVCVEPAFYNGEIVFTDSFYLEAYLAIGYSNLIQAIKKSIENTPSMRKHFLKTFYYSSDYKEKCEVYFMSLEGLLSIKKYIKFHDYLDVMNFNDVIGFMKDKINEHTKGKVIQFPKRYIGTH